MKNFGSCYRKLKSILLLLSIAGVYLFSLQNVSGQLLINTSMTPAQLVQNVLIGTGVQVSNVTFNSSPTALNLGQFSNGANTNLGLNSGVIMASGSVLNSVGPNNSSSAGNATNSGSDPQLAALIPGYTVNDASVLQFDFVPLADSLTFEYVFGSEEYPEYVNSSFNDVFGFFISGPNPLGGAYLNQNIAIIPGTSLPVTINNINNVTPSYPQYYINNTGGATIQYDGFTTVLTALAVVIPCTTYHIKLAVADAGDMILDSGVFLEANSFSSNAISVSATYSTPGALNYGIEGCNDAIVHFSLPYPSNDSLWIHYTVSGTATMGVDYPNIPDSILLAPGQSSNTIIISPFYDGVTEGQETVTLVVQTSPCTTTSISVPILDYTPKTMTVCSDTMICQGTASLWVNASGGAPPYTYDWTPITGLTNPNITNPQASPTSSTTYVIEVYDSTGCPSIFDTVVVTVNPKPLPSFAASTFSGCEPLEVEFTDYTTPAIGSWLWDFGDGNVSTVQNPIHTYQNAGVYSITLTVTTLKGCTDSYVVNNLITVHPQPIAKFIAIPEIAPLNHATIDFSDLSNTGSIWDWNFGDGTSSSSQHPSHEFTNVGYFTVCMTVSTPQGCMDSICHEILIINDSLVFPNVFTPNSDGVNDFFVIKNLESYLSNKIVIFNRWGKKVYEMTNYQNDWDGENVSDGTYFYILEYHGYLRDGTEKGSISILR
ncbi:choice-of-anchor L domain-containing protein [candidate division KSB1 bacterium]